MEQTQIIVKVGARIRTKMNSYYNRKEFISLATYYGHGLYVIHSSVGILKVSGNVINLSE